MKLSDLSLTIISVIAGCETTQPKFDLQSTKIIVVEEFKFEKRIASDSDGSGWRYLEIKPEKLPYAGRIASLTAEERWLKLFRSALESIKADCNGAPQQMPEIKAAELDYKKFGNSPNHPAYIQAKYRCQQ